MIVTFLKYCAIRNTISLQRYHSAFYFSVKTHADQVTQTQKNTLRLATARLKWKTGLIIPIYYVLKKAKWRLYGLDHLKKAGFPN